LDLLGQVVDVGAVLEMVGVDEFPFVVGWRMVGRVGGHGWLGWVGKLA
jgi:hypothetical protein